MDRLTDEHSCFQTFKFYFLLDYGKKSSFTIKVTGLKCRLIMRDWLQWVIVNDWSLIVSTLTWILPHSSYTWAKLEGWFAVRSSQWLRQNHSDCQKVGPGDLIHEQASGRSNPHLALPRRINEMHSIVYFLVCTRPVVYRFVRFCKLRCVLCRDLS